MGRIVLLFENQFDDIGKGLYDAAEPESEDIGPVGPQTILNETADAALQPDEHRDHQQRQQCGQNDRHQCHDNRKGTHTIHLSPSSYASSQRITVGTGSLG